MLVAQDDGCPSEVEWASEEPPQDQQSPGSPAESVAAATLDYRRKCGARRRSEERQLKEMEESPEWQALLRAAEEEEQQLWENPGYPTTPRYAAGNPMGQHIRTDIPVAHVNHSTRTFVAKWVRWRQQTVVWTWPEGLAEETAATEEPRIWEESGPRVSPLDPRTSGRPEHWAPSTPSTEPATPRTGPSTPAPTGSATVTAEPDEPLERGPWVWPEPVESGRPSLKRQH